MAADTRPAPARTCTGPVDDMRARSLDALRAAPTASDSSSGGGVTSTGLPGSMGVGLWRSLHALTRQLSLQYRRGLPVPFCSNMRPQRSQYATATPPTSVPSAAFRCGIR